MATVKKFNVRHGLSAGNGAIKDVISDTGLVYDVGTLSTLKTTAKSDTVTAINELFDDLVDITAITETNEPMGVVDRADSAISFDNATKTFSISVAAGKTQFVVWTVGVRRIYTTTQSVSIGASPATGLYYIYFNSAGVLSYKTTYFTWEADTPIAYVYWNATTAKAEFVADERHGIVLDWQTHEYLHRTRGAVIASGFSISAYTTTGDGSADAHAQFDLSNGTFFDEDLEVNITHSATPTTGTFTQILTGAAEIPVFYINGGGGEWVKDVATKFACKQSATTLQYNLLSGGVWSTAPADNNRYVISWVVATNDIYAPIITILGQAEYTDIGSAEAALFGDLTLTNFPIFEFRPLWKVIFKTSIAYANTPNAYIARVLDIRELSNAGAGGSIVSDHGLLTGLADDDHNQYIHTALTRTGVTAEFNTTGKITTTNIIGAGAGSAAAPSITIVDDLDTGIYSPGVNQLAISTGGVGRLFVASDGKVGIGTSSPSNKLQVEADTNGTGGVFVRNNNAGASASSYVALNTSSASFTLRANSTSHGVWPATALVNADSGFTNGLAFNTGTTAPIAFLTNNTERLRITSDGRVGIGTTSPIGKVDITGTSVPLILQSTVAAANYITHRHVTSGDIGYIGNGGGGALSGGTTSDYVIRANLGSLIFACNGDNERARIDSSGRLLVGTSSAIITTNLSASGGAYGPLQVVAKSTANANSLLATFESLGLGHQLSFATSRGSTIGTPVQAGDTLGRIAFFGDDGADVDSCGASILCSVDGTPGANDMPGRLVFSTTADGASSPTERMVIKADGKVGIGTSSPSAKLDVEGFAKFGQYGGAYQGITIRNNDNSAASTTTSFVDASNNLATIDSHIFFSHAPDGGSWISLGTTPAGDRAVDRREERLRITSDGKVGIGTSAPSSRLEVVDGNSIVKSRGSAGYGSFYAEGSTGSAAYYFFGVNGVETARLQSSAGNELTFSTGSAASEKARITSDGNVGIGTSSPNQLLHVNQTGVVGGEYGIRVSQISATANALKVLIDSANTTSSIMQESTVPLILGTNNTERLRITSDGKVGIGTNAPASPLDIKVATDARLLVQDGNATGNVKLNAVNNAVNANVNLEISASSTQFFNGGSERARITSDGKVGIGTNSPTRLLHVYSTGTTVFSVESNNGSTPTSLLLSSDGTQTSIFSRAGDTSTTAVPLRFLGGSQEMARFDASGRLLVGVSVVGTNVGTNRVVIRDTANNGGLSLIQAAAPTGSQGPALTFGAWDNNQSDAFPEYTARIQGRLKTGGVGTVTGELALQVWDSSSFTEAITIKADGKVGIGTSSPSLKLSVDGDAWFGNGAGVETGRLFNDAGVLHLRATSNVTGLALGANGSEKVRITSDGKVGIGTASPSTRLHVVGGASSGSVDNVATFVGGVDSTAGCGARIYLSGTPSVPTGRAAYIQAVTLSTANEHALIFGTSAAYSDPQERVRIDSSGRLLVGTSSSVSDTFGASLAQVSTTDGNAASFSRYSADAFAPIVYLRKSRGSLNAQGIVSSGDNVGSILFTGSDGVGFIQAATIKAEIDGTPGANDMPGRLLFSTTADGAASPTERLRITSAGNVGIGTINPGYSLEVNGSFAATTKSFVIPHPTKEGYKLRYGSLEGPENGVYVRGRSEDFVIDLPEYWTKLVDPDSITVNLTPIGKSQALWVKDIRDNRVYVGSKCSEVKYFYTVFAERADVDKLETEVEE